MPKYISAYDLQQREGLTRRQVLELAETRPCFWKVSVEGLIIEPDEKKLIDWGKYTSDRKYFLDGFGMLKEHAAKDWFYLASAFKNAWKTPCSDPDDKLGLDNLLYSRFPAVISGSTAIGLLEGMTPVDIQQNPSQSYALRQIIEHMDRGRMLNLVSLPSNAKTIDHAWLYLKNSASVVVDLFLDSYLRNWLFFDDTPQQVEDSPVPDSTTQNELPPFEMTNRVSSGTQGREQVKATCAENPIALLWIESLRETKKEAEIANWLLDADNTKRSHMSEKNNLTVISCLLRPDAASPKHARNQIEGVLRKK